MRNRIDSVDGWRIIAAMGVLYAHTWTTLRNPSLRVGGADIMSILNLWGSGVHLFFVISGFCFYLVFSKQQHSGWRTALAFWKKRWLRIAPAFYIVCTIYALSNYHAFAQNLSYRLFFNFIFLQNHVPNTEISGIFWSLAVEWHFYMLLPLIFIQIRKFGVVSTVATLLGLHLLLNLLHYRGFLAPQMDGWRYTIFCNVGHFAWGILLGYIYSTGRKLSFFSRPVSLIVGLVIAYAGKMFFYSGFVERAGQLGFVFESLGPIVMTLGFACMILSCLENPALSKIWGNPVMAGLGRVSYSFYLWHALVLGVLFEIFGSKIPATAGGVFLLMLIVLLVLIPLSFLSYKYLESFYFRRQRQSNLKTSSLENATQR